MADKSKNKSNYILQYGIKTQIGNVDIIERKGWGHPDKMADDLAEELSRAYSRYTLRECGAILHHNFDKLCLLGGSAQVSYGSAQMCDPIKILINGRATEAFAGKTLAVKEILKEACYTFFSDRLPELNVGKDLDIIYNISTSSSPGQVDSSKSTNIRQHWFAPRSIEDLPEYKRLYSNDTSIGTGFAPMNDTEKAVLALSDYLSYRPQDWVPVWLGTDIKVMAHKLDNDLSLTICVPQIARYVKSREEYAQNLVWVRDKIHSFLSQKFPNFKAEVILNARDILDKDEVYLTATGSSIESGDEGVVGRGNRINGLITPKRPMNLEGANGKNPVYHVGKLYNILAMEIAQEIYEKTQYHVVVDLISKTGSDLDCPWKILVQTDATGEYQDEIKQIIEKHLGSIPNLTERIVTSSTKDFPLC